METDLFSLPLASSSLYLLSLSSPSSARFTTYVFQPVQPSAVRTLAQSLVLREANIAFPYTLVFHVGN